MQNLREHGVEVQGKRMVILGAGGAATAICVQAALDGAQEIAIFNRADEFYANGEKTVEKLTAAVPACKVSIHPLEDADALASAVKACDLLVNATKVGMKPLDGQTLVDAKLLHKNLVIADTIYNPRKTLLIEQAEAAGCCGRAWPRSNSSPERTCPRRKFWKNSFRDSLNQKRRRVK